MDEQGCDSICEAAQKDRASAAIDPSAHPHRFLPLQNVIILVDLFSPRLTSFNVIILQ